MQFTYSYPQLNSLFGMLPVGLSNPLLKLDTVYFQVVFKCCREYLLCYVITSHYWRKLVQ